MSALFVTTLFVTAIFIAAQFTTALFVTILIPVACSTPAAASRWRRGCPHRSVACA